MKDCIFCRIINKEVPSYKIYENDYVYAFLDIVKDYVGHTLVIPKNHCKNILDCNDKDLEEVSKAMKLISNHYVNNCGYDGINITNANNEEANQSVFHLHFHIIPRKANDNINPWPFKESEEMDLESIQNQLKVK